MPKTKCGKRIDIILNPMALMNRLIPSSSYEHELNFISDKMIEHLNNQTDMNHRQKLIKYANSFITHTCKAQYNEFMNILEANEEVSSIWDDMVADGFYIMQDPFWDNIKKDAFWHLYDTLNEWYPNQSFLHEIEGTEGGLIVADKFIIKLKHEPSTKFSARSIRSISTKLIPNKNNMQYKKYKALYSTIPVRFGEQEISSSISLCSKPSDFYHLHRWLNIMSSKKEARESYIKGVLSHKSLPINFEQFEDPSVQSTTLTILHAYLKPLGLVLESSNPPKVEINDTDEVVLSI